MSLLEKQHPNQEKFHNRNFWFSAVRKSDFSQTSYPGKKKRNSKTFNWKILQFANRKREKFGKFRCCFHIYFTLRYLFKTNIIIFHCQGYKGGLIQADYCQNFSINFCSFPLFYFDLFQSFLGEKLLALIKNSY